MAPAPSRRRAAAHLRHPLSRLPAVLLAALLLGGCDLLFPGPPVRAPVVTAVAIDPVRPRAGLEPGGRTEVRLLNEGATAVAWQGGGAAGLTLEPPSGPLDPGAAATVTLQAAADAPLGVVEVGFDAAGGRALLDVEIAETAPEASSAAEVAFGDFVLALGDNSVGAVVLEPPGGDREVAWALRNDDPSRVAIEGADVGGDRSGRLAGGSRSTLRVHALRSSVESTPGAYEGALRLLVPAGEYRIRVGFEVASTSARDACAAAGAARAAPERDAALAAAPLDDAAPTFVPGQVIVGYRDADAGAPHGDAGALRASPGASLARAYGLQLLRSGGGGGPDLLRLPAGADPRAAAARLAADPRVAWAEPNRYLYPQALPDDPSLGLQWALCYFGAPSAWEATSGDAAIVVAVIDEGVDTDHPDLAPRLLPGIDLCPVEAPCPDTVTFDRDPNTRTSHGSHVSGIVAAAGDNGVGVAGVAWGGPRILPIKVFNDFGGAPDTFVVAQAIRWAAGVEVPGLPANDTPARIVNLSLGGCDPDAEVGCGSNRTLESAAADAARAGALLLASSGNDRSRTPWVGVLYPANGPDVLAVGAVHSNRQRASFSRFDATGGPTVDLMAPGGFFVPGGSGDGVLSTENEGRYGVASGTSMASPYAAGVAALLWSTDPGMTAARVRELLLERAVAEPGWNASEYGAGIVCPDAALQTGTRCGR